MTDCMSQAQEVMQRIASRQRKCAVFIWRNRLRVIATTDAAYERALEIKPEGLVGVYKRGADPALLAEDLSCFAQFS